ncbi:MAG: RluA family pseudouridine synthase [Phycisphaeraceae bacterium]|nr:RluA family pseudouridine synthase [Phycisphaeraceae bacterium]
MKPPKTSNSSARSDSDRDSIDAASSEPAPTPGDLDDEAVTELQEDDQLDPEDQSLTDRVFVIGVKRDPKMRLDVYLQNRLKGFSRARVQRLIDLDRVRLNDGPAKAGTVIRRGYRIEVRLPPPEVHEIEPQDIPLEVLHEDDDLIVINKPAGIIVHPARGNLRGTMVNALAGYFKRQLEARGERWKPWLTADGPAARQDARLSEKEDAKVKGLSTVGGQELRPGVIHRLDQNTTGCIVFAKRDQAHWMVARQFERRQTLKAYLAVVHGNFDHVGDVIDAPLGKHPTFHEAYAVRHDSSGKSSVTIYRVREQYRGYTLLELELKTGRTHQIRVHLSWLGHPIVGDILYGGEPIGHRELSDPPLAAAHRRCLTYVRPREEGEKLLARSMGRKDMIIAHPALHAALLRFFHPVQQREMTFQAPVHEPMAQLIRELRHTRTDAPVAGEGCWLNLAQITPAPA